MAHELIGGKHWAHRKRWRRNTFVENKNSLREAKFFVVVFGIMA